MALPGLLVTAVFVSTAALTGPALTGPAPVAAVSDVPAAPPAGCKPSSVLNLTDWKVTLPLPKPDGGKGPLEILQPDLAGYTQPTYFRPTPACDGVVFRAPVNAPTTSGSKNPRSELREMTDGGTGMAAWSSGAGTHRMTVVEAFTHLPNPRTDRGTAGVVGAQIHDADDDITVIRLEGTNLWITKGDDTHHRLITDRYQLGTRFEITYEVSDGEVRVFYNGRLQDTIAGRFRGAYFKAGAYTQANCSNSPPCSADNYGETTVYSVTTSHQVTTLQVVWDLVLTYAPWVLLAVVGLLIAYLVYRRLRPRRRGAHARR
jgi:hypothetical protein